MDCAESGRVPVDRHVIGRVSKNHRGPIMTHQDLQSRDVENAAAQDPVAGGNPKIAGLADGWP